jgi:hypothetical protein
MPRKENTVYPKRRIYNVGILELKILYAQKTHIANNNTANKKAHLTSTDGDSLDSIVFVDFI